MTRRLLSIRSKKTFSGSATTYYDLGVSFDTGNGPKNPEEAKRCYIKAAKLDHTEARTKLATMFQKGNGVEQDYAKAFKWFTLNAEEGIVGSQIALGDMFWDT
ncbi:hypothetical protein FBU30_006691 [Linnemannia zychae]|nr:hypothetical protein FBU30_006691 [Linnemannia zychae]